jgi:hypothetical protein
MIRSRSACSVGITSGEPAFLTLYNISAWVSGDIGALCKDIGIRVLDGEKRYYAMKAHIISD